jgi:hypothetical protein
VWGGGAAGRLIIRVGQNCSSAHASAGRYTPLAQAGDPTVQPLAPRETPTAGAARACRGAGHVAPARSGTTLYALLSALPVRVRCTPGTADAVTVSFGTMREAIYELYGF